MSRGRRATSQKPEALSRCPMTSLARVVVVFPVYTVCRWAAVVYRGRDTWPASPAPLAVLDAGYPTHVLAWRGSARVPVCWAKTAEPIAMPFGRQTRVDSQKHVGLAY